MFILDDILLSPAKGFMWLVRKLHDAANEELENEGERLTTRLRSLYMMLETGQITSEQFDAEEAEILARLDALKGEVADEDDEDGVDVDGDDDQGDADDTEELLDGLPDREAARDSSREGTP